VRRRVNLKIAIFESERTQREVARVCDIPETRLSSIIAGTTKPRPSEEIRLSELLGCSREELFEGKALTA
jgi:plasmid maintenance system antidote protein VapI